MIEAWLRAARFGLLAALVVSGAVGETDGGSADGITDSLSASEVRRISRMSPLPELPPDPSNAVADDPQAVAFGKRLFFDPRLSGGGDVSCATCHDPELEWTDGKVTSSPQSRFPKNSPSLWNTAFNRWFYWDGRADSAWSQALGPIESEDEMMGNRVRLLHTVSRNENLRVPYIEIFGPLPTGLDEPGRFPPDARPMPKALDHPQQQAWAAMTEEDRQAANVFFANIGKAIAAFERTLVVRDSPFDRFVASLRSGEDSGDAELSPAAIRGLKLFLGRGQCTLCHSGATLSDGEFHDLGIALGSNMRIDPGRHRGVLNLLASPFSRAGEFADEQQLTAPIHFLEQRGHQFGQFKTPMLRRVSRTAPYMHDGRFETLTEVVRFYSTREGAKPLGHPTTLLQPLDLSEDEIADLVAFLESL